MRPSTLRSAINRRIIPVTVLLALVVGALSFYFVSELDDELDRSVASLTLAVSNAIGPAYAVGNADVLTVLQNSLKQNQGLEIRSVSMDLRDMLTGEPVDPESLANYDRNEPIYYFPGFTAPEQVGTLYVRRTVDFSSQLIGTLTLALLLVLFAVVWFQRFLQSQIIRPLSGIQHAIAAYAAADFRNLALPNEPRIRELANLSSTVASMDDALHASRIRLTEESELRARERFEQEGRRETVEKVFHDIKNYITKIELPAKRIRDRTAKLTLEEADHVFLDRQCTLLRNTAEQMRQNITLARPSLENGEHSAAPEETVVNLSTVIGRLHADYQTLFSPQDIGFEVDLPVPPDGPLQVRGDAIILQNCLDNLLKNALDHFTNQPLGHPARVRIRAEAQADRISVFVEDNGKGLPASIREDFERGRQIPSSSGWGVGLLYIKKNIRQFGGDVVYAPNLPSGSRFELILRGVSHAP